jgi:uncharacterized protein (TIGR02284 family)
MSHTERSVLNHLIEVCTDGQRGFLAAAEHVGDPALKDLFTDLADQRGQFAAALVPHAQRLGGDAAAEGTQIGRLHRSWMNLRGFVSGNHDHAIVAEAERGEEAAVRAYRDVLNEVLSPEARDLIEQQLSAIAVAHERVLVAANGVTGRTA